MDCEFLKHCCKNLAEETEEGGVKTRYRAEGCGDEFEIGGIAGRRNGKEKGKKTVQRKPDLGFYAYSRKDKNREKGG